MKPEEKDKIAADAVRVLIRFLCLWPLEVSGHLGDLGGRLAHWLLPKKKQIAYWNMRAALGSRLTSKQREKEILEQFRHLGRNAAEVLTFEKLTQEDIAKNVTIHNIERFEKVVADKKGVVLLTAHYGNWELLQTVAGIRGNPIHVLGRDQKQPQLNEILMQQREVHGAVAVSKGMNVRFLLKALKDGGLIGVLGDQSAGKESGILLPFFGRVTSVPSGAFELARRTNSAILPCFMLRTHGNKHEIFVEEPLKADGASDEEIIRNQALAYLRMLESYIEKSPRQWLWQNKRWKYSWTRNIVVLSDGKPGHFKQSQAIAALFPEIHSYHGREGLEFKINTIEIRYRSEFHRKLLFATAWILAPFIRSRLDLLKIFLEENSLKQLAETQADLIIAAGSSMAPVQHLFAEETGAKKIVLMKPPFPYGQMPYDLAIIPEHDENVPARNVFRTLISPSGHVSADFREDAAQLQSEIGAEKLTLAVFIGGRTRDFDFTVADAEKLASILERSAEKTGKYILTTSRRTSEGVERFFKHQRLTACVKRVIANEDTRPFIAKGMLELAKIILVTEDSLAMISEAAATGKTVIVLRVASDKLPEKHRRFLEKLTQNNLVIATDFTNLGRLLSGELPAVSADGIRRERENLILALEKLL